jgi:hypothetical protein
MLDAPEPIRVVHPVLVDGKESFPVSGVPVGFWSSTGEPS